MIAVLSSYGRRRIGVGCTPCRLSGGSSRFKHISFKAP